VFKEGNSMTNVGKEKDQGFNTKKHVKRLIVEHIENESIKNHILEYIENLVNSHTNLTLAHKRKCDELNDLKKKHWK
jgi:hypothetical protein